MVINLNKKMVTKESLLEKVSDWDVYNMYIPGQLNLKDPILSPLREESKPSFGLFIGERGEICFKDFKLGSGDCIKFVQMKFGLDYFEAMSKIALDARLDGQFIIKNTFKTNVNASPATSRASIITANERLHLTKKSRKFELFDLSYWNQFGIDHETLVKYNVTPVSHIFFSGKIVVADKHAYCFTECKDGVETYKIYQPFNETYKWLNSHNESVWQGWEQLPKTGTEIIITKSLKDVMAINKILGIPAVSLQAEGVIPKEHIIEQLRARFTIVFLLYDNDYDKEINWGREFGKKIAKKHELIQIEINETYKSKDFSDLVKTIGKEEAKKILEESIEVPF
jgi:hypothetical protein